MVPSDRAKVSIMKRNQTWLPSRTAGCASGSIKRAIQPSARFEEAKNNSLSKRGQVIFQTLAVCIACEFAFERLMIAYI
jgi:hypothetical protein